MSFYTILTTKGIDLQSDSIANGTAIAINKMEVGDGNGAYYEPSTSQTALVNVKYSAALNSLAPDTVDGRYIATLVIPAEVGGFYIREACLKDSANNVIAIAKVPESYKPVLAEGSGKTLTVKIVVAFNAAASVTMTVDNSVVYATRDYAAGVAETARASAVSESQTYATQAISQAIADLINSAPGALDTLNELASALGDDPNFAATVTNALALKAPLASPALTGTPTTPTASMGTVTDQIASTKYVIANANRVKGLTINSSTTLTLTEAAYAGFFLMYNGVGDATWALYSTSAGGYGMRLTIKNTTTSRLFLTYAGGISDGIGTKTTMYVSPGEIVELISDGSVWYVCGKMSFVPRHRFMSSSTLQSASLSEENNKGSYIQYTGAGGNATWSLYAISTGNTGEQITIKNASASLLTLTYANGIYDSNLSMTSIVLIPGEILTLASDGSTWFVVGRCGGYYESWAGSAGTQVGQSVSREPGGGLRIRGRCNVQAFSSYTITHLIPFVRRKETVLFTPDNTNGSADYTACHDDVNDPYSLTSTKLLLRSNGSLATGYVNFLIEGR